MARSTDFCFKKTYVSMVLRFRSIVCCFQCFVRGSSPFGKVVSHETPLPLGNYSPWTPLPLGISNGLPWGGGGGMDIFWNHTLHHSPHGLGGYSKLINRLRAAASGTLVCWCWCELTVHMLINIVRGHICCPLIHDSFLPLFPPPPPPLYSRESLFAG